MSSLDFLCLNITHECYYMGITLWLVPSAQDTAKLKNVMNVRPSDSLHTSTSPSYPDFHPHITLASFPSSGAPPLETIRAAVPTSHAPLAVEFKSIEIGNHFFRSVYLAIKQSSTLSALHERVHEHLGLEPRTPAFPHISLCYINDDDGQKGEREAFLRELERHGRVRRGEQGVGVDCGEGGQEDWLSGFEATEVWVADCDGPVDEWSIIDKISLVVSD